MADDVPRGTTIRRFVVLGRIGAGAMGVVYAAYDYTLERKLALKLVRGERVHEEAQALAKLSHPNVVAIYDVGTYGDRVYIAMEHVDGGTLRDWLAEPRPESEIVRVLRDAGAGLAAAHAAQLVHGDFKPENVLIDTAGACKVGDFGLAQHAGGETRGATPAYAAPGGAVTPASDQFSFCVTAYEALYGRRPFVDDDPARGFAPVARRISPRIRAALVRGLALAPEARWASMQELLAALAPRRTRSWTLAAALAAAVASVGITLLVRGDRAPTCSVDPIEVARVWSPARRGALQARLPAAAFARVAPAIDHYVDDWSAMQVAACRATRIDGTQSEPLLDLRTECLRRRLGELDAELTALDGIAGPELGGRAIDATHALAPLATCADVLALQAPAPLPRDPAARAQITGLEAEYATAKALYDTGRDREALAAAKPLAQRAAKVGYRPLEAEVLHLRGRLEYQIDAIDAAEVTLRDAIAAAQAGNEHAALARSWLDLIWVVGELRGRYDEAEHLAAIARGAIEQAASPKLAAGLEDHLGCIAFDRGDFAAAKQRLERALALREVNKDPEEIAASLQHVALIREHDGDEPAAIALLERAVDLTSRELGPEHGATGEIINTLAGAQYQDGQLDAALASWRRALEIAERVHGPHSLDAASVRTSIALGLRDKGELAEALDQATRGRDDFLAINGEDHPEAPHMIINHGFLLLANADYTAAEAEMLRARALLEKRFGADAPEVIQAWIGLGQVRFAGGDAPHAVVAFERGLALREQHHVSNPEIAAARVQLAEALAKAGDLTRARKLAQSAREIADAKWRARADALLAAK